MTKFMNAAEAAKLIPDNAVIISALFGNGCWPQELASAMEDLFLTAGRPSNITHIHAPGGGDFGKNGYGEDHWAHDGMMTRLITSHASSAAKTAKAIADNKILCWLQPLGTMLQVYREMGRSMPGALSKTGLGTFMDPRKEHGAMNQATASSGEKLVEYIPDFQGTDWLFYKAYPVTHAFIRGTYADANGNISVEKEAYNVDSLSVAQAAKARGGKVFVQVQRVVEVGSIHPRMVKVPGIYVDVVVVAEKPELDWQTHGTFFEEAFTGAIRVPMKTNITPLPLGIDKVICRRVAYNLKSGSKCNFGIGKPTFVGNVLEEEGARNLITTISESGNIGGVPGEGLDFGAHWNLEAACDQCAHFSFFDGGGLDYGIFGLSEVDKRGNINTSLINGKPLGVGGFANIAATAKNSIFMGEFAAGGLEGKVENGKLVITKEGKFPKFVAECEQVTLDAVETLKRGNTLTYITERCVIICTNDGLILSEVAPGIDYKKQILDLCPGVDFIIPQGGPKSMPPELFQEKWGGLKDIMGE